MSDRKPYVTESLPRLNYSCYYQLPMLRVKVRGAAARPLSFVVKIPDTSNIYKLKISFFSNHSPITVAFLLPSVYTLCAMLSALCFGHTAFQLPTSIPSVFSHLPNLSPSHLQLCRRPSVPCPLPYISAFRIPTSEFKRLCPLSSDLCNIYLSHKSDPASGFPPASYRASF